MMIARIQFYQVYIVACLISIITITYLAIEKMNKEEELPLHLQQLLRELEEGKYTREEDISPKPYEITKNPWPVPKVSTPEYLLKYHLGEGRILKIHLDDKLILRWHRVVCD